MSQSQKPQTGQQHPQASSIFPGGTPQQILNAVETLQNLVRELQAQVKKIEDKLGAK